MLRLGLTGGIGAGKSTVARRLADLGAAVVDADVLAREVVEPGSDGLAAVVEAFGDEVLTPDGALDRPALGRAVFADPGARTRLNAILHPRIAALTAQRLAALPADVVAVHDVPLLVENRMGAAYHLVLVVHAPVEERVRRLVTDRGMSEDDARARIAAQADDDARRAAADVWLDNGGPPGAVEAEVDRLWKDRIEPYERNLLAARPAARPVDVTGTPEPGEVARVAARVVRATGVEPGQVVPAARAPAGDAGIADVATGGVALELHLAADADPGVLEGLARAGFFGSGDGAVYTSADPVRPASVRLVAGAWAEVVREAE